MRAGESRADRKYVMALDQGTTSSRAILFNQSGEIVSTAQREFSQFYPQPGWVEHDALEIWESQLSVAREAIARANASGSEIAAVGITNQRETTVVWDRETGLPICRAIVWQCRRTADFCGELAGQGLSDFFQKKTGLLLDPYFSATKLKWILENVEGARKRAESGKLLFGTIDTWLIWNLTGGRVHVTDYSNAARTMLFDIENLCWDREILELLDIPEQMLPQPVQSSQIYGYTDKELFGESIPIGGAAGDQQAALFGQTCFSSGEAKNTYGTGCFLLMNTGERPVRSQNGLLTTIAWGIGGRVEYALEGSVFVAGAAIKWLRDEMNILECAADSERMARAVPDTGGVYFVPAFVGLGAPYWDPYARGTIVGLSRGTNRNHLVRAALESLAYQTADLLSAMEEDSGVRLSSLQVDGGACANNFLMEFQADVLGVPVRRPVCIESTALGAAYLAGIAAGFWDGREAVRRYAKTERIFDPAMSAEARKNALDNWHRAVKCSLGWEREKKEE